MDIGFPKKKPYPPDQSCVCYWKMNDTSGNLKDWSSGGYTATKVGTVTYSVSGKIGDAITFDGSTAYFTTTAPINSANTYTFLVWVKYSGSGESVIVSQVAGGFMYNLVQSGGTTYFINWTDTDAAYSTTNIGDITNTWTHLAWIANLSTGTISLYKNGLFFADNTSSLLSSNNGNLARVGSYHGDESRKYGGSMQHLYIYNRTLSSQEIKRHYMVGR